MVGYICHRFKLGRCWYIWNKPDVLRKERFESSAQLDLKILKQKIC